MACAVAFFFLLLSRADYRAVTRSTLWWLLGAFLFFLFLLSFFRELLLEEIADALETVEFVGVMMIYEGVCLTVAFCALREAVEAVVFVDITYLLLCILLYSLVGLR